jgi:hypothetical protein
MGKGAARDLKKESAWRRRLGQHADSGQSVRAWCREHRVTETAFYWWRRELARRDRQRQPSARRDASFVPVHVTDGPAREGNPQIEIVLTDGRRIRIIGPVHGQTLADVLDVLERRAC